MHHSDPTFNGLPGPLIFYLLMPYTTLIIWRNKALDFFFQLILPLVLSFLETSQIIKGMENSKQFIFPLVQKANILFVLHNRYFLDGWMPG